MKTLRVPLSKLYTPDWKLQQTINEVRRGLVSHATGQPIIVSKLETPRGAYFVMDGNHRVLEAIERGETKISAVVNPHVPNMHRAGGAFNSMLATAVRIADYVKRIR